MTANADPNAVCARMRSLLATNLREEYPWMKDDALSELLDQTVEKLKDGLVKQESVMAETKSRCNFFSLSAELRNNIYELDLDPSVSMTISSQRNDRVFLYSDPKPLLETCQQIRAEALPMYYGRTLIAIFEFDAEWLLDKGMSLTLDDFHFTKWLRAIGPKSASHIKHLCLEFCTEDVYGLANLLNQLEKYGRDKPICWWHLSVDFIAEVLGLSALGVKPWAVRVRYLNSRTERPWKTELAWNGEGPQHDGR